MAYLILDLEMSGTEAGYHDIIQIGCVLADNNWNKISEFESLVYPDNEETFSSYSEKIHGISLDDLEDAPIAYDVFEELEAWIRKALRKGEQDSLSGVIVCGQSVINDINFMKVKYSELNISWPFSPKLIDLLSLTFIFYKMFDANNIPKPKSYSLNAVSKFFGYSREEDTHNALEDAKITFLCFKKYFELAATATLTM